MGCEIHLHIHYRPINGLTDYRSPFGGEFRLSRNYLMFGVLGATRQPEDVYIEPKGIPEFVSYGIKDKYYYRIVSDEEYKEYTDIDDENIRQYTTKEKAEKWGGEIYTDFGTEYTPCPDWHSTSWLTPMELEWAYEHYLRKAVECDGEGAVVPYDYRAILSAAQILENGGENEVQIVFWFDN